MAWKWPWPRSMGNDGARLETKEAGGTGFIAFHAQGEANWTRRDYATLAREGFMRNPIVHRAVRLIAESAASIPWLLYEGVREIETHPLLDLLERPNQRQAGATFLEALYGHLLLAGNAYVELVDAGGEARELHLLRPDRVTVVTDASGWPVALDHREGAARRRVMLDAGSAVHLTLFHPLEDHYGFASRQLLTRPASLGQLVEDLEPGVEGRVLRNSYIRVELFDADAASVSLQQMLNGANAAAVRSAAGAWEVIQFRRAEQVADNIWMLSELLRGQLGTTDAMLAGAASGSDFVILDDAVVPAGLAPSEIGLELNWKIGPAATDISDLHFATSRQIGGLRARIPLAPVHLSARLAGADVMLSWKRRGRLDADGWDLPDIPLGEEKEEYRIEIAGPGGETVRTLSTPQPNWLYPEALIAADFGVRPGALEVTVRQAGGPTGWGIPSSSHLKII